MKNVNLAFRKALITALSPITYKTKAIPIHEEYLEYTTTKPATFVTVGNQQVECYIILRNQTANDNSAKCVRNDEVSIQVQIYTVFGNNKGGSLTAEEISEVVMNKVSNDGLIGDISIANMGLWRLWVDSYTNLQYNENTNRIWTTIVTLNGTVTQ